MDPLSLSIVALSWFFHALLLASPVLLPPGVWLPVLLARCCAETLVLVPSLRAFRRIELAGALPAFFVALPITLLLFPPIALLYRRVSWKGRTFGTTP